MATAAPSTTHVVSIGETAGITWSVLSKDGPMSVAKLVQAVGSPRDMVMQALGWLAREEKIWIEEEGRSRIVSIR